MDKYALYTGNNVDVMRTLADNSIDSIVTDPPYGLSKEADMAEVLQCWLAGNEYKHNSKGFMGKEWDSFVPSPMFWKECYRVLKPGGHVLSFFGTRTYDIGVMAMRLAGFEIRDQLCYAYGSGFPKGLNIGKAVDKYYGYNTNLKPSIEPICLARKPLEKGLSIVENVLKWGTGAINIDGCRVGSDEVYTNASKTLGNGIIYGASKPRQKSEIRIGRYPSNLLLDGSDEVKRMFPNTTSGGADGNRTKRSEFFFKGLNPLNTKGGLPSSSGSATRYFANLGYDLIDLLDNPDIDIDSIDPLFYTSKASPGERNAGLKQRKTVNADECSLFGQDVNTDVKQSRPSGVLFDKTKQNPLEYCKTDDTFEAKQTTDGNSVPRLNTHPTVKPVRLMQWLVRLITPPGSICLDPFNGSGSTGIGCLLNRDIKYIGIDMDAEYIRISNARLLHWSKVAKRLGYV